MWTHEVKFDGFRIQIHKDGSDVALFSRNGHDFTSRYPGLVRAFSKRCSTRGFILDAELTAIDSDGHPDFGALLIPRLDSDVCVWVFDLLSLRGQDLRSLPLVTRRYKLDRVMGSCGSPLIQYSQFFSDPHALLRRMHQIQTRGRRLEAPRPAVPLRPHDRLDQGQVRRVARGEQLASRFLQQGKAQMTAPAPDSPELFEDLSAITITGPDAEGLRWVAFKNDGNSIGALSVRAESIAGRAVLRWRELQSAALAKALLNRASGTE